MKVRFPAKLAVEIDKVGGVYQIIYSSVKFNHPTTKRRVVETPTITDGQKEQLAKLLGEIAEAQ